MSEHTTVARSFAPMIQDVHAASSLHASSRLGKRLAAAGLLIGRKSVVILLMWFGVFKWTPTEAAAIQPLLQSSPLTSWLTALTSVQGASILIGLIELSAAGLMILRPWAPRLSAVGSLLAALIFLTTLSFLITTPGTWVVIDGLLVPSGAGGFLIKDIGLLAAAIVTAGEALSAGAPRRPALAR